MNKLSIDAYSNNNYRQNFIRRYLIIGERRLSNYWWAFVVFLGSVGFLLTGISSYFGLSIGNFFHFGVPDISSSLTKWGTPNLVLGEVRWESLRWESLRSSYSVSFFPQGLLMSFYGSLGFLLSLYWWFLIFWNVGGGFNEFDKKNGYIRIFRWGYPGKNRRIDFSYALKDVEAIKVEFKQVGLSPAQRTIYLRLKGKREIPLTGIGQPLTLKDIEKQASELANFLQVSLEGL
uniref:Photosystem I assembly protein Ycf4 n=1 Tax=Borodinellopsis insignis TaxID=3229915 RepID=A0AB39U3U2_9CHLO